MTRRTFAATLAVPSLLPAALKSKLKFGLTSYQWGAQWDIPAFIANCTQAGAFGVELRTSAKYKHGVELDITPERRREVKKMFADSPVKLIGVNSAEKFDSPDPAVLRRAIEAAKAHVVLAHDVGATGIRVFPNAFQKGVPEEVTLAQIAKSVHEVGVFAREHGQRVRLEAHGPVGTLPNLKRIMDQVESRSVGVKLNGDVRDNEGGKFAENFALVKDRLGDTLHWRVMDGNAFPYPLQWELLIRAGWEGWCMVEESVKVPDIVKALTDLHASWDQTVAKSLAAASV